MHFGWRGYKDVVEAGWIGSPLNEEGTSQHAVGVSQELQVAVQIDDSECGVGTVL